MRVGWICQALVSAAILAFGIVAVLLPMDCDGLLVRADGLASTGLGLFGGLIASIPFRRRERWAWWALWFYPVFWTVHLVGGLPPRNDHVHQVVLLALSLTGLLLPVRSYFPRPRSGPVRTRDRHALNTPMNTAMDTPMDDGHGDACHGHGTGHGSTRRRARASSKLSSKGRRGQGNVR